GAAEPRHADPLADGEAGDDGSDRRYPADDFMTRNNRQLRLRKLAVDHVQIGPAHSASCDFNEQVAWSRRRSRPPLGQQRRAWLFEHHRPHGRHGCLSSLRFLNRTLAIMPQTKAHRFVPSGLLQSDSRLPSRPAKAGSIDPDRRRKAMRRFVFALAVLGAAVMAARAQDTIPELKGTLAGKG